MSARERKNTGASIAAILMPVASLAAPDARAAPPPRFTTGAVWHQDIRAQRPRRDMGSLRGPSPGPICFGRGEIKRALLTAC